MKGFIFDIKRYAIHDGDGIRTTVFLKGCSLWCKWCHNPEGISFDKQIGFFAHKCISCGACVPLCEANTIKNGAHIFDREKCTLCGKCLEVCPKKAFEIYGCEISVDELVKELMQDKKFYDASGGGVTLSGGECLCQFEFCREVLMALKSKGVHTAIDTAGNVDRKAIEAVAPYTDIFLYDIKHMDSDKHKLWTGAGNKRIFDNLNYLKETGKSVEIRIPYIPRANDECMKEMALRLSGYDNITKVRILPYHPYAKNKYNALGYKCEMNEIESPSKAEIEKAKELFASLGLCIAD